MSRPQTTARTLLWTLALNTGCLLPESMPVGAGKAASSATASRGAGGSGAPGAPQQPSGGRGGQAMSGDKAANDTCARQTEICNRKDDDCDGRVDELGAAALDCASKLLNASSICENGRCVKVGDCNEGFHNCDGMPDNGCESACRCGDFCEDDAGSR